MTTSTLRCWPSSGPDDKSKVLGKLKDIPLCYQNEKKSEEGEKNQGVKDMLDKSKFEELPDQFEMVLHNSMIARATRRR